MVGIALHVPLGQSVWIGSITTERGLRYVRSRGTRLVRAADGGPAGWPCHVVALVLSV